MAKQHECTGGNCTACNLSTAQTQKTTEPVKEEEPTLEELVEEELANNDSIGGC